MNSKLTAATLVVLVMAFAAGAHDAQAARLLVMAVNTTAIAGAKVFTIGVRVSGADLTYPGVGANPVLQIHGITFGTPGAGPVQAPIVNNKSDLQTIQSGVIDDAAFQNPVAPGNISGPPLAANLGVGGTIQFYKDSWFYQSAAGTLVGVHDSSGNTGVITSKSAADGSGVYTIGANANSGSNAVGPSGYLWLAGGGAAGISGGVTTGDTFSMGDAVYGPAGSNILTAAPLAQVIANNGGYLDAPLAQIITTANLWLPELDSHGEVSFIQVGQRQYAFSGWPVGFDLGVVLDYTSRRSQLLSPPRGVWPRSAASALCWLAVRENTTRIPGTQSQLRPDSLQKSRSPVSSAAQRRNSAAPQSKLSHSVRADFALTLVRRSF